MGVDVRREPTTALFASSQFLTSRIVFSALIGCSILILVHQAWPILMVATLALSALAQRALGRRHQTHPNAHETRLIWFRTALSLVDTSIYAIAAIVLSYDGSILATMFSLTVILLTLLYVLLHYFTQPRLIILLSAPCYTGLILLSAEEGIKAVGDGHPLEAAVPALGVIMIAFFFLQAQRQLARSRLALVNARSQAVALAEAAEEATQAKSAFLAVIGHEITTPLNGVLGMAQAIAQDDLSERQHARLLVLRESGENLLAILNDLLDFSLIEAGTLDLELHDFSMDKTLRSAEAAFAGQAAAKGIGFTLAIEDDAGGLYRGDPARITQVMHNLISNAIKFTDSGTVTVSAACEGHGIRIRVADTGIGVPQALQAKVFDHFVQADLSATRRYGGAGLGLAIAKDLVRIMGGDIALESVAGKGSTFTVHIPLQRMAAKEAVADRRSAQGPVAAEAVRALRVLAAEDNATNQMVLRLLLEPFGIEPRLVEDGEQAVGVWEAEPWDLILMDIQMPVMDGCEATRQIRRREMETARARTPILAVTANAMPHQCAEYIASGMDGVVAKPVEAQRLFTAISNVLEAAPTGAATPAAAA